MADTRFKKGHPPLNVNGEGGRPVEWTEERATALAEKLDIWIKDPKSLWLKTFCRIEDVPIEHMTRLAKKYPRFCQSYKRAVATQEEKLVLGGLFKNSPINNGFAAMVLARRHGWVDGKNIYEDEDEDTASSKAIKDVRQAAIEHADNLDKPPTSH